MVTRARPAPATETVPATLPLPGGREVVLQVPASGDVIGDALLAGTYELAPSHLLLLDLVEEGTVMLDIGAHLGTVTVPAALAGASVVAVEASPRNAALLRTNTTGLDVMVMEAAAGAREGTVAFRPDGAFGQVLRRRGRGSISVRVITGDELTRAFPDAPGLVKLDVEGHEVEVLEGLEPALVHRPPLVFESNAYALALHGTSAHELSAVIEAMGYEIFRIDPDNRLFPAGTASFQARSWIDCLAVTSMPDALSHWTVAPRPTVDDTADDIGVQARDPHVETRGWLATALRDAPADVRSHPKVVAALELLADDSVRSVRRAARRAIRSRPPG